MGERPAPGGCSVRPSPGQTGRRQRRRARLRDHVGVERIAFLLKIRPGVEAEYVRRHDEIWPEMAEALRKAGARNYSIFFDEDRRRLFAYLEAEPDVATYRARISADPVNARWQEYMSDLLVIGERGLPRLEQAFHLD